MSLIGSRNRPHLFIASSGRATNLADQLKAALDERGNVSSEVWTEDSFHGTSILKKLLDKCDDSDFVAVILTQDDLRQKSGESALLAVPRDNCIFELGMFLGALNLNTKRCFLLTTLSESSLPTDLKGELHIPIKNFNETDLWDLDKCENAMRQYHTRIETRMLKLGVLGSCSKALRPLAMEYVLCRECPMPGGDLRAGGNVYIDSDDPLERNNTEAAERVLRNIHSDVRYTYFFSRSADERHIAQLFQVLATGGNGGLGPTERKEWTRTNQGDVKKNLKRIRGRLSIFVRGHDTPLQFCIHNAKDKNRAKCYLRTAYHAEWFVKWSENNQANKVAIELERLVPKAKSRLVFRPVRNADREYARVLPKLKKETLDLFDDGLHKLVKSICFGK